MQNCTGSTRVRPVMLADNILKQRGKQCHRSIDSNRDDPDLCDDSPDRCACVSRFRPGQFVLKHLRVPWHQARAGIQWDRPPEVVSLTRRQPQLTGRRHCENVVTAQHSAPHNTTKTASLVAMFRWFSFSWFCKRELSVSKFPVSARCRQVTLGLKHRVSKFQQSFSKSQLSVSIF